VLTDARGTRRQTKSDVVGGARLQQKAPSTTYLGDPFANGTPFLLIGRPSFFFCQHQFLYRALDFGVG